MLPYLHTIKLYSKVYRYYIPTAIFYQQLSILLVKKRSREILFPSHFISITKRGFTVSEKKKDRSLSSLIDDYG